MITYLLLVATLATLAGVSVVCLAAGWVLGYQHRSLIEWGVSAAYRRLLGDVTRYLVRACMVARS